MKNQEQAVIGQQNQTKQNDQICFTLFSHEQYVLDLPGHPSANYSASETLNFYNDFSFYQNIIDWKGRRIIQAPVVRLYGNDKQGKNVCLHVHGYFPYFYIKVSSLTHLYQNDTTFFDKFIELLEECYFSIYSVSDKQKKFLQNTTPIILDYQLVYKKDIYGYHSQEEPFLKISYINPKMLRKLINVLESRVIMNQEFIVYEGHLTYFLRFYTDLGIAGLREVKLLRCSLRRNENVAVQALVKERQVSRYYLDNANTFNQMTRQSASDVEVDVYYKDILNYIFLQQEQYDDNFQEMCQNLELQRNNNKRFRECAVSINRSLNMFWEEEHQMQKDLFGIQTFKSTATIDYTDNIESLFIDENEDDSTHQNSIEETEKKQKEKEELLKKVDYDIYWINQLKINKSANKQFKQHIQDYIESRKSQIELAQGLFVNTHIKDNFNNILKNKKIEGIQSIETRNKRYGQRKVSYYEKLQAGQVKELDQLIEEQENSDQESDLEYDEDLQEKEFNEDNSIDSEDIDKEEQDLLADNNKNISDKSPPTQTNNSATVEEKLEGMSLNGKKRKVDSYLTNKSEKQKGQEVKKQIKLEYEKQGPQNNVQIWRNNFNAVKNNINLEDSLFVSCQYCRQLKNLCRCIQDENKQNNFNPNNNYQSTEEFFKNDKERPKNWSLLRNKEICPSFADIMKSGISSIKDNQYAYYENLDDLFDHYNIRNKQIPRNLQYAQILDKDLIKTPQHKQYYVGLKNELKLPSYYRSYIADDHDIIPNPDNSTLSFIYQAQCPSFAHIQADFNKEVVNQSQQFTAATKNALSPFAKSDISQQQQKQQSNQLSSKLMQYQEDLSMYTFEVFAKSIPNMLPNPQTDSITFLVYILDNFKRPEIKRQGIILVDEQNYNEEPHKLKKYYGLNDSLFQTFRVVKNEEDLLLEFIKHIHFYNVDIITGWDIEKKSLFYLSHRCWYMGIDIMDILARCPTNTYNILRTFKIADGLTEQLQRELALQNNNELSEKSQFLDSNQSFKLENIAMQNIKQSHRSAKQTGFFANFKLNFTISGRMILNAWRIVKHDYKLFCYELESVVYALFQERMPIFSNWSLTTMFNHEDIKQRAYVFEYMMKRLMKTLDVAEHVQIINTCSEETKLYGFDFQSAINKGHQFRIEHIMNRVTEQLGYKLMSASKHGVQTQKMLECSPLTLEPPKLFYVDPVIVLDFQSLYPSLMIAYNMCYSTCLGNIEEHFLKGGVKRLGVQNAQDIDFESLLKSKNYDIEELMKDIFVAPNKVAYVKKNVREGVIPLIVHEFFFTRLFIKANMNKYKNNPQFSQIYKKLHQRQKSLKLFMCVIFGYTGATFSGRMPLGELADSIIQTGKFLLNQVITLVNTTKKWNAQVIYGDTDSVFVNIKGASVKEAISIGKEIESEVSRQFPYPIKLKYEKTFKELIMVTKKRYVGYQVENETDEPKLEAKGIELIRKDGCQALNNIMKNCLEVLMKTKNLSGIKAYLSGQWQKLLNDQISYRDLIISKECKLENYTMPPPHAKVAMKEMKRDPQSKPKYGQRINYMIISNPQSQKLSDCVVSVSEYMKDYRHQLNFKEYIDKYINAALARLFSTFDVDINDWYLSMKKNEIKQNNLLSIQSKNVKDGIKQRKQIQLNNYYSKEICIICSQKTKNQICENCSQDPVALMLILTQKKKLNQINKNKANEECKRCTKIDQIEDMPLCIQHECYSFFEKKLAEENVDLINPIIDSYISKIDHLMFEQ